MIFCLLEEEEMEGNQAKDENDPEDCWHSPAPVVAMLVQINLLLFMGGRVINLAKINICRINYFTKNI
jgi:hypothetical protein